MKGIIRVLMSAPAAALLPAIFAMQFGPAAGEQGGEKKICGDTPVVAVLGEHVSVDETRAGQSWGSCAEKTYGKEWNDPKLAKNKSRKCVRRPNYTKAQVCYFWPSGVGKRECYYKATPCRRPGPTEEPIDACSTITRIERDDPIRPRLANTIDLRNITTCSGSLVTFEGRTASQKALVLTAGHCIGKGSADRYPGPGEVFKNQRMEGTNITIRTFGRELLGECIGVNTLLYATMTDIDIALYELTETYQELAQRIGAVPFWVSRDPVVAPGTKLRAPSGHHEDEPACTFAADVGKVKEHVWTWGPLMRLAGCTLKSGASGSPLISETDGRVVGVAASAYEDTNEPCSLNNPCEVDASGQTSVRKDTAYGQYAHRLAACVNASGDLDLSLPTCALPR